MFYTYIHYTADSNRPFYIGKGKGNRHKHIRHRNQWWQSIVAKHGFRSEILAEWQDEKQAFEHEKLLIACFREMNYSLCNISDGGEGNSSPRPNARGKKRPEHSAFMKGRASPTKGKKIGRNEARISYGKNNGMYGKSAVKGRKWYNNGQINLYLTPTDIIPEEFYEGRLPISYANRRSYLGKNNPNYKGKNK